VIRPELRDKIAAYVGAFAATILAEAPAGVLVRVRFSDGALYVEAHDPLHGRSAVWGVISSELLYDPWPQDRATAVARSFAEDYRK